MARIRTIKPEFFTSSDIVCMSPLSRLFYAALWCESDREGRLKWDVKTLKLRYFPADDCDIQSMANELIENELIVIYEVDGKHFAEIPSFKYHQIINNRESESTIPTRYESTSHERKTEKDEYQGEKFNASFTRESGVQGEGKEGREGKGREGASKRGSKNETAIDDGFAISENVRAWAEKNGHDQLDAHLANFIDSCKAKGYRYSDWDAAFRKAISGNWAKVAKLDGAKPVVPDGEMTEEDICARNLAAFKERMR